MVSVKYYVAFATAKEGDTRLPEVLAHAFVTIPGERGVYGAGPEAARALAAVAGEGAQPQRRR